MEKEDNKSKKILLRPAMPGAGRPKGSTNKVTAATLLAALNTAGLPFEQALARNYIEAQSDRHLRYKYDQLFLGKLLADQTHITVDETSTVENRQQAFLKALETIGTVALQEQSLNKLNNVEATLIDNSDNGQEP